MTHAVFLGATIVSTATLVVLGCLAILAGLWRPRMSAGNAFATSDADAVFIFRGDALIDCSDRARKLLDALAEADPQADNPRPLAQLLAYLDTRFPEVREKLAGLVGTGAFELASQGGDGLILSAVYHKGLTRLCLSDTTAEGALLAIDRLSLDALQREVQTLRGVVRNMPALVWQTDHAGRVVWANAPYIKALRDRMHGSDDLTWPLPALFSDTDVAAKGRLSLQGDQVARWFNHSRFDGADRTLNFATPIDSAVQSEAAKQETLQTLARTFASVPIGLALFDSDRRLQVFNPALMDLTGLEALFLAARPSFEQVLYALREKRMLPEPKNFNDWRREIITMEKAAESGEYSDEWCLEGGLTYHVTGRPQPNGAIALFLRDVTTEATLTRSFRTEIEMAHKVMDALGEGVVVFSVSGQTLLANAPYIRLWQTDPCADLADRGLAQAIALWVENCAPTTFWARLAEFVADVEIGDEITGSATLKTGAPLSLRARRLSGGNVMLVFHHLGQTPVAHRPDIALQSELIRTPDLALARPEHGRTVRGPEQPSAVEQPHKPRSARHVGTRVRA